MGRKLNLSHLSERECRQILDVIQRDYNIRQKEKERLLELQKVVKEEEQKRLVLSRQKQFNLKYCMCCFSSFGLIFNKRTECTSCGYFICRDCLVKPEAAKAGACVCLGCMQQRDLQVQVCEWFYGQIRNRFRRFGSAKVVRSLYKRESQSSESFDRSSNDSGVDHQLSPLAKGMSPEEASEAAKAFIETLEKQTSTAHNDLLGIPYKALLDNPDWLPIIKPETSTVAIQAPEDVLSDILDSRQALEDFVFNLPPEEEELVAAVEAQIAALKRSKRELLEGYTMGIAGPDSGKYGTVSVAMCHLTSPERKARLSGVANDTISSNGPKEQQLNERHRSVLEISIGSADDLESQDVQPEVEDSFPINEIEETWMA